MREKGRRASHFEGEGAGEDGAEEDCVSLEDGAVVSC